MPKGSRRARLVGLLTLAVAVGACAPAVTRLAQTTPSCPALGDLSAPIRWIAPASTRELEQSRQSCEPLGPVAVRTSDPDEAPPRGGALFVISWNVATGEGQVQELVRRLADEERRANRPEPDVILLLQEAFRGDDAAQQGRQRNDVLALSERLGMDVVFVPALRVRAGERGNAILSTLPLRDVAAIELPFVRQRRVAVAARVDAGRSKLTVISIHLATRERLLRGSVFSAPFARDRQTAALVAGVALMHEGGSVIVAGDFNTFAGLQEPALRRMEEQYARISCGSPITHQWGLSLDHFFAGDPAIVQDCSRMRQRYGSDHHPLVARVAVRDRSTAGVW